MLAFGFVTPWLLWGTLLAGLPVLVHLLFQRRYQEHRWAAMQFLEAAQRRRSRWSQVDQWLLLALRMLIPLAAAVALAGPFFDLATGGSPIDPVHRVLILDASLSMQARDAGRTQWTRAKELALDIVDRGQPGDTWQLYAIGQSQPISIISTPTFQTNAVRDELRQLEVSYQAATVADGLAVILADAAQFPEGQREIHLLTDAQRTQWQQPDPVLQERLQQQLKELQQVAAVIWHDVSESSLGNWAVTDVTLAEPFVMVGQAIRATAIVRQFGNSPAPAALEWRIDGRLVATQPLVPSTAPFVQQELQYVPTGSGELRVEASIRPDALTADDRRGAVCLVRDALRVLLVDGRPSGTPFENATDCLRLALAPETASGGRDRIVPKVITDGELLSASLDQFDVVFLSDVPQLTEREGEILANYVASGGGLVIGLGPSVRAETYARTLGGQQRSLLPASIGETVGDARRRNQAVAFSGTDLQHPILSPFRGNPNTGFELTQTFAYRKLQPINGAKVAVFFENSDAAIVERRFGRGRVVLLATAVDRSWGTWAVWGHTFVPMMHELVRYLMAGPLESRHLSVGHPLIVPVPVNSQVGEFEVVTPDEQRLAFERSSNDNVETMTFDGTRLPGFYAVKRQGANGSLPQWFAVNIESRESNLAPLLPVELQDGLGVSRTATSSTFTGAAGPTGAAGSRVESANPLSRSLLGIVLLLLIAEPFFTWNRRLGFVVIASLAGTLLIGAWGGPFSATLVAAVCGGAAVWQWRKLRRPTTARTV